MSQICDVSQGKVGGLIAALSLVLTLAACAPEDGPRDDPGVLSLARMAALTASADPYLARLAARVGGERNPDVAARPIGWDRLDIADPPSLGLAGLDAQAARRINGFLPALGADTAPAPPFRLATDGPERERALLCLTQAIYYEAALEPDAGQAAVAQVVLNRVRHPAFPHSICGVVYQGVSLGLGCQFTFACDGALDRKPVPGLWRRAQTAAERAVDGYVMAQVGSATSTILRPIATVQSSWKAPWLRNEPR